VHIEESLSHTNKDLTEPADVAEESLEVLMFVEFSARPST
jgi:hypothetical protein